MSSVSGIQGGVAPIGVPSTFGRATETLNQSGRESDVPARLIDGKTRSQVDVGSAKVESGNAAANDLRSLFESATRGAPRSANLDFIKTLAGRKSVELLPGVKLLLSGNAANDASAVASIQRFLKSDPGLRASLASAGKTAPIYVIVGDASMFKPLGGDTLAINFGANNANGKLAGVVVALDRNLLNDRFTVENEFRESAMKGNLGLRPRNAEEEASSLLVSNLYRSYFGKSSRPASAAELLAQSQPYFQLAQKRYIENRPDIQISPDPQTAQKVVDAMNKRLDDLGLRKFADGNFGFKLVNGSITLGIDER